METLFYTIWGRAVGSATDLPNLNLRFGLMTNGCRFYYCGECGVPWASIESDANPNWNPKWIALRRDCPKHGGGNLWHEAYDRPGILEKLPRKFREHQLAHLLTAKENY